MLKCWTVNPTLNLQVEGKTSACTKDFEFIRK